MLDERADENERKMNQMNIHLEMLADKLGDMYERVNTNKCLREYADSDEELSTESEENIGDKLQVELIGGYKKNKKTIKSKKNKKQTRNIRKTRKKKQKKIEKIRKKQKKLEKNRKKHYKSYINYLNEI